MATVASLVAQGVSPGRLLVVDNSEDRQQLEALKRSLHHIARLTAVQNRGYGHAANVGIEIALGLEPYPAAVLVATHEVNPQPGALTALEASLAADPTLGAVGPALVSTVRGGGERVTSGGVFTRLLNEPRQVKIGPASTPTRGTIRRGWLDGAFVLYRSEALHRTRFREDFFLYYEETELQTRLTAGGWGVACVADARVHENSSGVPPMLRGRNLQWFQQLHGSRLQRGLTVPSLIAKTALKALLKLQAPTEAAKMSSGWRAAIREPARPDQ